MLSAVLLVQSMEPISTRVVLALAVVLLASVLALVISIAFVLRMRAIAGPPRDDGRDGAAASVETSQDDLHTS